ATTVTYDFERLMPGAKAGSGYGFGDVIVAQLPRSAVGCWHAHWGGVLMGLIPACFSESYAEARAKFCRAAAEAGGAIRSWFNPNARGPDGERLYLDTARVGPADAENMLVLISSTHGVEGHCGSGAQIAWLATGGADKLPRETGALIVHAINPYGFAWTRR